MNCRDYAKCRVRSNERDFPYKASNGSISAMSSSRSKFLTFWTFEITPSVRHATCSAWPPYYSRLPRSRGAWTETWGLDRAGSGRKTRDQSPDTPRSRMSMGGRFPGNGDAQTREAARFGGEIRDQRTVDDRIRNSSTVLCGGESA